MKKVLYEAPSATSKRRAAGHGGRSYCAGINNKRRAHNFQLYNPVRLENMGDKSRLYGAACNVRAQHKENVQHRFLSRSVYGADWTCDFCAVTLRANVWIIDGIGTFGA